MERLTAEQFKKKYPTSVATLPERVDPKYFNFNEAGRVFSNAGQDINTAQPVASSLAQRVNSGAGPDFQSKGATATLQGGLAVPRAIGAGILGTETGKNVTGSIIENMTKFGEAITPDSVLDYVGKFASDVIEGYQAMSPQEQVAQRNKLAVSEILSYYSGGAVAKPVLQATQNTANVIKDTAKSTLNPTKSADSALAQGQKLRTNIQSFVGEKAVGPQVKASAERIVNEQPTFLTGSAVRVDNVVKTYDDYFAQSAKAINDIKTDPAISEVGSKMGDAFTSVIKQRQAVGKELGTELKTWGNLKVGTTDAFDTLIAELKDSGLSYNPRTRQLTSFQGSKFVEQEIDMLSKFVSRLKLLGNEPTVRDLDNFIAKTRTNLEFTKGETGVLGATNAERIITNGVKELKEALNPSKNGIQQLNRYWEVNKVYSELSDFVDEGGKYLGKVTQSGDFAKDASIAKSAVQSILNNGKKDWMLKLEALTGYNALDDAVIALQAMKDAGDFRGLSLLQAMKDSGIPTSKAGFVGVILDKAVDVGKRVVAGSPEDQTRAFLQSLQKTARDLSTPDKKLVVPKGIEKTKEMKTLETKIAKNVSAQKVAIKEKNFVLVAKLKQVYDKLVTKLKEVIKFVKENASSESGHAYNPLYKAELKQRASKVYKQMIQTQDKTQKKRLQKLHQDLEKQIRES